MTRSENAEREHRILDAAIELIVHFGYDKTTVDDIARQAAVSKGAIYLHFESKDDLFKALLTRELGRYSLSWLESIEADPQGGTIGGMYRNMLNALCSNPFISAMFKQDRKVFGRYLRKPDNFFRSAELATRQDFVRMMQRAGVVRKDIQPGIAAHIMNMLAFGLVSMDDILPEQEIPPLEEVIDGIGDFMDRALTPPGGGDSETGKAILARVADTARKFYGFEES
ncbi:MAG: TetR/AcrR family transcriptional regulator [Anaerolineales bacterium]|nr:TetR/AcrR family transcriptional regulator [Anaerolineales bacterium]